MHTITPSFLPEPSSCTQHANLELFFDSVNSQAVFGTCLGAVSCHSLKLCQVPFEQVVCRIILMPENISISLCIYY